MQITLASTPKVIITYHIASRLQNTEQNTSTSENLKKKRKNNKQNDRFD